MFLGNKVSHNSHVSSSGEIKWIELNWKSQIGMTSENFPFNLQISFLSIYRLKGKAKKRKAFLVTNRFIHYWNSGVLHAICTVKSPGEIKQFCCPGLRARPSDSVGLQWDLALAAAWSPQVFLKWSHAWEPLPLCFFPLALSHTDPWCSWPGSRGWVHASHFANRKGTNTTWIVFAFQKFSEVHRRFYYIQVFCYASFYLVPFLRCKENDKGMFLAATNGLYMRVTAVQNMQVWI